MSAMTTDVHITPRDLGGIPRPVALVICELVNNHGVTYRLQQSNGGHVFLYNGDSQTRPFKISGSRQSEDTMTYLEKWIRQNVPAYFEAPTKKDVTPADVAKLAAVVNTAPKPEKAKAEEPKAEEAVTPDPARFDPKVWSPARYGFVTDGTIYRCTYEGCDYEQESSRGLHLHEYRHTGQAEEMQKRAVKTRALNDQQKQAMIEAAIGVIAEQYGLVATKAGGRKVDVDKLIEENDRLKRQVEDLKARVSLITEALKA